LKGNMRILRKLKEYIFITNKTKKEKELFRNLKTEVEIGANGTQRYVIKEGKNKGKVL